MMTRVFISRTAAEGLAEVRATLGEGAVVLATRPHPAGIEILAARYDALARPANDPALLDELTRIRGLLAGQLAGVPRLAAETPLQAALRQGLAEAGFSAALVSRLLDALPSGLEPGRAQTWIKRALARNLKTLPAADWPWHSGGRLRLVAESACLADAPWSWMLSQALARWGVPGVAVEVAQPDMALARRAREQGVALHAPGEAPADVPCVLVADAHAPACEICVLPCDRQPAVTAATLAAHPDASMVLLAGLAPPARLGGALDALIRRRLPVTGVWHQARLTAVSPEWLVEHALRGSTGGTGTDGAL